MRPNQTEPHAYAQQGYNRAPFFRVVLADSEAPLSVFCKLNDQTAEINAQETCSRVLMKSWCSVTLPDACN